jgi:hypothetical protein
MKKSADLNEKYKLKQHNKNNYGPNWGFGERSQKNKRNKNSS